MVWKNFFPVVKSVSDYKTLNIRNMIFCALFTTLMIVGAFIKIPVPVVPFTLQFLFSTLAGLLLGGKLGALSVMLYTVLGLLGLPVFASGGGITYVLNPNFGYLIGFAVGAWVTGSIASKKEVPSKRQLLASCFAGLFTVYLLGMIYYWLISTFYLGKGIGLWTLFLYCFLLAVPGDIALCFFSVEIGRRLLPVIRQRY